MTSCHKIPYATPAAAARAGAVLAAKYLVRGAAKYPRGVHPCAKCRAWHITSAKTKPEWRIAAPR